MSYSYIMCIAHQQRWVIRCISMQGLSFKYIALCIPKFTIYIKTIIKGNVDLGIPALFLNMYIVSCMQDKIGKLALSYYFNDRIIVK